MSRYYSVTPPMQRKTLHILCSLVMDDDNARILGILDVPQSIFNEPGRSTVMSNFNVPVNILMRRALRHYVIVRAGTLDQQRRSGSPRRGG